MAATRGSARAVGTLLVAVFLALVITAPWNPLLEPRFVFLGFLILIMALGMAMTVYGVYRAWPPETELLPGTDDADRERELRLNDPQ